MYKILIFYLILPYVLTLFNQDKSIETSQYDCIVSFMKEWSSCTGTFISDNVLITAQHCISKTGIYINNNKITDYESTTYDDPDYDVGFVKFNKFKYNCSSYFKIIPDFNYIKNPIRLRGCGYGLNNDTMTTTDTKFGCRDLSMSRAGKDKFYYFGISTQPGDSGSPIFAKDTNHIHAIVSKGNDHLSVSDGVNKTKFDEWYFQFNDSCIIKHEECIGVFFNSSFMISNRKCNFNYLFTKRIIVSNVQYMFLKNLRKSCKHYFKIPRDVSDSNDLMNSQFNNLHILVNHSYNIMNKFCEEFKHPLSFNIKNIMKLIGYIEEIKNKINKINLNNSSLLIEFQDIESKIKYNNLILSNMLTSLNSSYIGMYYRIKESEKINTQYKTNVNSLSSKIFANKFNEWSKELYDSYDYKIKIYEDIKIWNEVLKNKDTIELMIEISVVKTKLIELLVNNFKEKNIFTSKFINSKSILFAYVDDRLIPCVSYAKIDNTSFKIYLTYSKGLRYFKGIPIIDKDYNVYGIVEDFKNGMLYCNYINIAL